MSDLCHKIALNIHAADPLTPVPGTCWIWELGGDSDGYGKVTVNRKTVRVHRVAYELWVGPIPRGMTVDHLCRQRRCCNPEHLELVTNVENVLRGESPMATNARKTVCANGHDLTEENSYVRRRKGRGESRECRVCKRLRMRTYRARKKFLDSLGSYGG